MDSAQSRGGPGQLRACRWRLGFPALAEGRLPPALPRAGPFRQRASGGRPSGPEIVGTGYRLTGGASGLLTEPRELARVA